MAPGESDRERARRGVREWVRASGRRTAGGLRRATPYGIFAFLTASAIAPVVAPTLGATGEFAAALNQLGGMGSGHLTTVLSDTAARLRAEGGRPTAEQWRDGLAEALAERLAADDQPAARLRVEVGEVLRAVDAVAVAMTAATGEAREFRGELARAVAELGGGVAELRWLLDESARALGTVQQELALHSVEQREQIDLTRRSLVAVTELRREVLRALPAREAPDAGPDPDSAPDPEAPADLPCPYPGLGSFQPEDAQWFSGREDMVAELLGQVAERSNGAEPLVVVGVSGAGKSSLLRAGLLPAVARGDLPVRGSQGWPWLLLTPGGRPVTELVARTAALAGRPAVSTVREVRAAPSAFGALAAEAAIRAGGPDARLLIVVDQFEEVFAPGVDPAEQATFVAALTTAAPALVVIVVRADFFPQCTGLELLAPVLSRGQFVVGPLQPPQLRRAIREPAERAGLTLEPGLVELLLSDLGADSAAGYEPGALPLLAHALRATWQRRRDRTMTVAGYRDAGGIRRALAETAERIFAQLDGDGQEALRRTMLAMVTVVADGSTVVRQPARRTDLPAPLVDRLIAQRLVVADRDRLEISHEALLEGWPRLAEWLEQDRQGLLLRRQLDEAAGYWRESGEDESALYRGARLAVAQEWAQGRVDLRDDERRFLTASAAAAEATVQSERQRARRLRRLAVGLAAALVAVGLAGVAAWVQTGVAREREAEALSRQYAAESLQAPFANPATSMRLALDAWGTAPTAEARGALLSAAMLSYAGQFDSGTGGISVAVSPDGSLAAIGYLDGSVRMWDTVTRAPVGEPLTGHQEAVYRVAFSPDGALLASAAIELDGVRVWRVPDGEPVRVLPGLGTVDWLPTGGAVVATTPVAEGDQVAPHLGVWDARTGEELIIFPTGDQGAVRVAVSPDGSLVAGGFPDGTAGVWRLADGDLVRTVSDHADGAVQVAFSPDGQLATAGSEGSILLHDLSGEGSVRTISEPGNKTAGRPVFTPDGFLLTTGRGQEIHVYKLDGDDEVRSIVGFTGTPIEVALSADGRTMVATGADGPAVLWHRSTFWLPYSVGAVDVAFDPTGERFAVGHEDGAVRVWDTATRSVVTSAGQEAQNRSVVYAPDGSLASTASDGTVRVAGPDGEERAVLTVDDGLQAQDAVFSPDGSLLAASATTPLLAETSADRIYLWEVESLRLRGWFDLDGARAYALAFTPDGTRLLAVSLEQLGDDLEAAGHSTLHTWRTDDLAEVAQLDLGPGQVVDLAIGPDGRTLALAGESRHIQLRDLTGERPVREFGEHLSTVREIVFSPDGRTLATVTVGDQVVRLWDVATGSPLASLYGHEYAPNAIAFSPDGRVLASVGPDPYTALWTVDPAAAIGRLCRVLAPPQTDEPPHPVCG